MNLLYYGTFLDISRRVMGDAVSNPVLAYLSDYFAAVGAVTFIPIHSGLP